MKQTQSLAVALVALALGVNGAAAANYTSLSSALAASPNNTASVFVQAVAAAGLGDAVLNVSSFTIFIPTDAAFAAAIAALNTTAAALLAQTDLLTVFLGYHASTTVYDSEAALVAAGKVATMANQTVSISSSDKGTQIKGYSSTATIVKGGFSGLIQKATSTAPVGAFYTIDTVLIPDLAALMDATPPPSANTTADRSSAPSVAAANSPSTTTAAGPSGITTANSTKPNAAGSAAAPAALMAALAGLLALAL